MKPLYFRLPSLIVCTFMACAAFAQGLEQKIDAYLQQQHQAGKFNGNVLVVDHGKKLLTKSYGYADAAHSRALTTRDRFHIGSIAKEFDAVGIMMLVDEGKLKVTDHVSKYFPELHAWAASVTVLNLLQYTSGLPDVNWKTVKTDGDNWRDLLAVTQLKFEPGTQYDYNNNNTFMRRRLIEKISGMSFDRFVRERLLKPAGIRNAVIDPDENTPTLAKPFDNDLKAYPLIAPITGWTCLDLEDFLRWSNALNTFKLISPAATLQLSQPFKEGSQTGLGRNVMNDGKITEHTHDGVAIRYQALLHYQASASRTIILMTNQRQGNVYDLAAGIEQLLDNDPSKTK
ncbi:beta-lactamase family protein [Mucilaginibacter daejeonensis]|uniref:serine hydrolase domain-containing protein n=1 Tax=Mucilaginibacter daejeonensis TaxID=398049 RepID=UPI001D179487|nr:serine hydrolase domain-containing protein [Mucilaginibacter daejeonensis]UEG53556.1 beta-lactamase family protein [Mucilaginibacter daejeonensis]